MSSRTIDFWFDFSCPFAYLGSTRIEALAKHLGATLVPKPMLLGGVFKAREVPQNLFASLSPEKNRHNLSDMNRFAALYGVPLRMPAGHPLRTVLALRSLLAAISPGAPGGGVPAWSLIHRFYRAYWVDGVDISERAGVERVLSDEGLPVAEILARAESVEIKDQLRQRTDQAIELGVFGAPTMIVTKDGDSTLIFGQDRFDDVAVVLGGTPLLMTEPPLPLNDPAVAPVDFFYDYSSSYSAIASARVDALLGNAVRYRPMLLGGVFKAVNPANAGPPILAMSVAKRKFVYDDVRRQARKVGLALEFPSRFPIASLLALRATIAAGPDTAGARAFTRAIFRAYWVEDQDLASPEVVLRLAEASGLDGPSLIAQAEDPRVKQALKDNTAEAIALGVFGAPAFVVRPADGPPALFWGDDRLELAARLARGDLRLR